LLDEIPHVNLVDKSLVLYQLNGGSPVSALDALFNEIQWWKIDLKKAYLISRVDMHFETKYTGNL